MTNNKYSEYKKIWYLKNRERILQERRTNRKKYSKRRLENYHKNKILKPKELFNCIFCKKCFYKTNKIRHLNSKSHILRVNNNLFCHL